jgi:CelD/BcsL family acetyltransferase involved in cellulose biosynthesis
MHRRRCGIIAAATARGSSRVRKHERRLGSLSHAQVNATMSWSFQPACEFSRYATQWDSLAAASGDVPFLHSGFVRPLLSEFATGDEKLAILEGAGGAQAMTLIRPKGRGVWETYQPSQLPLGPWVQAEGAHLPSLVRGLLHRLPGFAIQVGMTQLDPRLFARPPDEPGLATLDYIDTAWIPVTGSFEEYWDARGKNLRTNLRKQRRKLESDGVAVRFDVVTRQADVAEAIEQYGSLESAGWKATLGTAIDAKNAQGRFYRAVLENFCAAGAGRIYRCWLGDHIVAMDLCIESRQMLVVLKTTYDQSLKSFSPASLLREEEMRAIFQERKISDVEFYGKVMDWHTQWSKDVRTLYHLNCFRWAWMARIKAYRAGKRRSRSVAHATNAFENKAG